MQRYFIDQDTLHDPVIHADEKMAHHMEKVMRFHNGDQVICVDSDHRIVLCTIADIKSGVLIREKEIQEDRELAVKVTLIIGIPKGDRFETVLQKATELGVSRIVPFLSRRSVVKLDEKRYARKKVRYQRILQEAAEQCERAMIPEICDPIVLKDIPDYLSEANLVAYEEEADGDNSTLHDILKTNPDTITIITGPEGGFDLEEIQTMESYGISRCSLGHRILRAETAPLYLLSVIGYEKEVVKR